MMDFQQHIHGDSNVIVFAFASGGGDFSAGIPQFEFGNLLRSLGVSFVLLRDSTDRWYQNGIQGIGNRFETAQYIGHFCLGRRAVSIGVSSGAYAALLYGQIALVHEIIAISPITGKGEDVKPDFPPSWWHRIEHGPEHPPVPDLRSLFMEGIKNAGIRPKTIAFVSDGEGTELDRQMAERIGIRNIRFIPGQSHAGLAKHMRDTGLLARLITEGF